MERRACAAGYPAASRVSVRALPRVVALLAYPPSRRLPSKRLYAIRHACGTPHQSIGSVRAWMIYVGSLMRQAEGRSGLCRPPDALRRRLIHKPNLAIDEIARFQYNGVTPSAVGLLYTVSFAPLYTTVVGYFCAPSLLLSPRCDNFSGGALPYPAVALACAVDTVCNGLGRRGD